MKNKITVIIMYLILALPVPISLLTWIGTIMSVASIGMLKIDNVGVLITTLVAFSAMILAGTYPVSYSVSLYKTIENKRLKLVSFLPVAHILLAAIMIYIWSLCG